jgi:hypothetical protein
MQRGKWQQNVNTVINRGGKPTKMCLQVNDKLVQKYGNNWTGACLCQKVKNEKQNHNNCM